MTERRGRTSAATKLVAIAEEIFTFGCVAAGRRRGGDPEPIMHTWAAPRDNPDVKRPLADIRTDLADVYQATYGAVPNASALGDAMTVLEGRALKSVPAEDEGLAALLGGQAKSSVATKLVEMARERFQLGVTSTGEAYAVPIDGPNVARTLRGGRRSLRSELARIYFAETTTTASASALADALLVLEGDAQGAEPAEVALRVGRSPVDGRLVLDLGGEDGRAVVIGAYGWEIVACSPVLFWRTNATLSLPIPDDDGSISELRDLLNVSEVDWPLVVAWLVAALIPELPHPVLLLRGEHGTAKSSAARLLTSLIDRCACQLRTAPRNVEDWVVATAGSWATCLDNISDIQPWLQDAMCRAVTGDGLLRRQLYTDADVSVLAFRRVLMLTSVDPGRLQGDLADRTLTVELERIPADQRSAEEDLNVRWAKAHPRALGGLLHVAVNVLRELPAIRRTDLSRMADFSRVLLAVDAVQGSTGYATYAEQASKTAQQVAEGDSVAIAIREHIKTPWEGTANDLLQKLTGDKPAKDWPATPQGMGGRLVQTAPILRFLGWIVEHGPRTSKARQWCITPPAKAEQPEERPTPTSPTSPTSPMSRRPPDQGCLGDDTDDDPDDNLSNSPGTAERHDNRGGSSDDPGDNPSRHVAAGHDDGDVRDNPAGHSSSGITLSTTHNGENRGPSRSGPPDEPVDRDGPRPNPLWAQLDGEQHTGQVPLPDEVPEPLFKAEPEDPPSDLRGSTGSGSSASCGEGPRGRSGASCRTQRHPVRTARRDGRPQSRAGSQTHRRRLASACYRLRPLGVTVTDQTIHQRSHR